MIENKIASSGLLNLDLSDFKPKQTVVELDIAPWLWEGIALKESLFNEHLDKHDWTNYSQKNVALFCSVEAIIPNWAYMMIVIKLKDIAQSTSLGKKEEIIAQIYLDNIHQLDVNEYVEQRVLIKGCGDVPAKAFIAAAQKLTPVVKSLMFGEACSAVPLFKQK
mgnify:CR=1 FL=1